MASAESTRVPNRATRTAFQRSPADCPIRDARLPDSRFGNQGDKCGTAPAMASAKIDATAAPAAPAALRSSEAKKAVAATTKQSQSPHGLNGHLREMKYWWWPLGVVTDVSCRDLRVQSLVRDREDQRVSLRARTPDSALHLVLSRGHDRPRRRRDEADPQQSRWAGCAP